MKNKENSRKVGISQLELAKRMGYISNSYIGDVESGKFIPSMEKLKKMEKVLGVPFEELEAPWFELKIKELGVKDPELIAMFEDIPRLPEKDKRAVVKAYLSIKGRKNHEMDY